MEYVEAYRMIANYGTTR